MMIWTSSWFTKLPETVHRIGISRGTPRGQSGYSMMRELAPGPWFNKVSTEEYFNLYTEQLAKLDPQKTIRRMAKLGGGADVALLCFEAPHKLEATCHRAYVSAWLHDALGLEVREFTLPEAGFGWAHPKLPPHYRQG